MEIIIISDSHGNISNFKFVMMFAKKIKAKAVIHCGDWDNLKTAQAALSFKLPLYAVLGNADTDTKIDNFLKAKAKRFEKNFLVFEIEGRRIGVIHNCQYLDSAIGSLNLDIVFCGHRHFKFQKKFKGIKIIGPGALYSDKPSFALYDTDKNEVEFFDL